MRRRYELAIIGGLLIIAGAQLVYHTYRVGSDLKVVGLLVVVTVFMYPFIFSGHRGGFASFGSVLIAAGLVVAISTAKSIGAAGVDGDFWNITGRFVLSILYVASGVRLLSMPWFGRRNTVIRTESYSYMSSKGPVHVLTLFVTEDMGEDFLEKFKIEIPEVHIALIHIVGTFLQPHHLALSNILRDLAREGRAYVQTYSRKAYREYRVRELSKLAKLIFLPEEIDKAIESIKQTDQNKSRISTLNKKHHSMDLSDLSADDDLTNFDAMQAGISIEELVGTQFVASDDMQARKVLQNHVQTVLRCPVGLPVFNFVGGVSIRADIPFYNNKSGDMDLVIVVFTDLIVAGGIRTSYPDGARHLIRYLDGNPQSGTLKGPLVFLIRHASLLQKASSEDEELPIIN